MKYVKPLLEAILYVVIFMAIQFFVTLIVTGIQWYRNGSNMHEILEKAGNGTLTPDVTALIIISVISSILTLLLFLLLKWAPATRTYLRSRPWAVMAWVTILAFGTLIPSTWLGEQIPYEMPAEMEAMLNEIMRNRWGYLAVGILAPLTEEVVFRGAVLRVLLKLFGQRWHWLPIALSAVVFGLVHGNIQQFVHATLIGLILGWMYYRTDSILPGIVFHWVNNSAAYVIANLLPNANEVKLVDLFGGDQRAVYIALGSSLCLMLPALFQLYQRLRKAPERLLE